MSKSSEKKSLIPTIVEEKIETSFHQEAEDQNQSDLLLNVNDDETKSLSASSSEQEQASLADAIIKTFYISGNKVFKRNDKLNLKNRKKSVIDLVRSATQTSLEFNVGDIETRFTYPLEIYPLENALADAISEGLIDKESIKSLAFIGIAGKDTRLDKPAIDNAELTIFAKDLEYNTHLTSFTSVGNRQGQIKDNRKPRIKKISAIMIGCAGLFSLGITGLYYSLETPEIFSAGDLMTIEILSAFAAAPSLVGFLGTVCSCLKIRKEPAPAPDYHADKSEYLNDLISFYADRNSRPSSWQNIDLMQKNEELNELKYQASISSSNNLEANNSVNLNPAPSTPVASRLSKFPELSMSS